MTAPDFCALCVELLQAWQFGDDIAGPMNRARAALKTEPEGEGPRPDGDWFTVALLAQDMRSRGLAEQVAGEDLLKLANSKRSQPLHPASPPAPVPREVEETAQWLHAHALDCRVLGRNDWAEQCTRAATLLQRQCAPPAPEPGEVGELVGWLNQVAQYLVDNGVTGAPHVQGAAILLERQDAELIALRQQPHPTYLDAICLAQGCHDYSGGHSGAEGEAWHSAIDTVVAVLKRAAVGPWDSQTRAVYGVGVEAQAGEVAMPVAELDDEHRAAIHQAVAEALGSGAYDCTRVWSAWQVGTMGEDDFVLVAEDPDRVAEIADAAIEAIRAIPAPQAGEAKA